MSSKGLRKWISCIAAATLVFGQLAITVHACPALGVAPAVLTSHSSAPDAERSTPCADMDGAPADAQGNACEAHCNDGIFAAAQPDVPAAMFTALPAPTLTVVELRASDAFQGAALVAVSCAPPLTLQFCRLLI